MTSKIFVQKILRLVTSIARMNIVHELPYITCITRISHIINVIVTKEAENFISRPVTLYSVVLHSLKQDITPG